MNNSWIAEKMGIDFERDLPHLSPDARSQFPLINEGFSGQLADCYTRYMEAPFQYFYCASLTCLGNVLAGKLSMDTELKIEPRLYTALLGNTGNARKSTAIDKVVEFYRSAGVGFTELLGVGSAEGLQKSLAANPNLVLVFDEFKQFTSKTKIEGSVLLPCVNTLYESNDYHNITKTSQVKIDGAHLSILAASTTATYETLFDRNSLDIGFLNRLLIVPGNASARFPLPPKIPLNEKEMLHDCLRKVLENVGSGLELKMTAAAYKIYEHWYLNREDSLHAVRLEGLALRLMMLMAADTCRREIDEVIAERAISIADWQLLMRKLYDPIDADTMMARMEESIRRQLEKTPLKERELKQKTNYKRVGIYIFKTALRSLVESEEVCFDKKSKEYLLVKM